MRLAERLAGQFEHAPILEISSACQHKQCLMPLANRPVISYGLSLAGRQFDRVADSLDLFTLALHLDRAAWELRLAVVLHCDGQLNATACKRKRGSLGCNIQLGLWAHDGFTAPHCTIPGIAFGNDAEGAGGIIQPESRFLVAQTIGHQPRLPVQAGPKVGARSLGLGTASGENSRVTAHGPLARS